MARTIVYLCAAVWLVCVVISLLALGAPAEGDSFLRGFNRVEGLLTWQFAALAVAFVGAVSVRFIPQPRSRTVVALAFGPIAVSALLFVALVALVAWAAFAPPPAVSPAESPPPAVTEPAVIEPGVAEPSVPEATVPEASATEPAAPPPG